MTHAPTIGHRCSECGVTDLDHEVIGDLCNSCHDLLKDEYYVLFQNEFEDEIEDAIDATDSEPDWSESERLDDADDDHDYYYNYYDDDYDYDDRGGRGGGYHYDDDDYDDDDYYYHGDDHLDADDDPRSWEGQEDEVSRREWYSDEAEEEEWLIQFHQGRFS